MTNVRPEAEFIKVGVAAALADYANDGKLETTAILEAQSVDVTVGDVDLTGDAATNLNAIAGDIATIASDISDIKTNTDKNTYDDDDNLQVNLNTALSSTLDSIDVNKMSAGGIITAFSAVTASKAFTDCAEIDCTGFGYLNITLEATAVGTSPTITLGAGGSMVSGGTIGTIKKDVAGTLTALAFPTETFASVGKVAYQIPALKYMKLSATLAESTATFTVKAQPTNHKWGQ